MKTEEVLNLDCTDEQNKKKLNKFLYNVKTIAKQMGEDKTKRIPLEVLEKTLHNICVKYGYGHQGISSYCEEGIFKFYTVSLTKKRNTVDWIGNAYGKTMWELFAKMIVKIYADIMQERKKE